MLRVLSLQFLFQFRVGFPPKSGKILRDLDRTMVGSKYLDRKRDALGADLERPFDAIQILDTCG
jgi:hypothetical protein